MRISFVVPMIVLALGPLPAAGQDILQPLREMVQAMQPEKPPVRAKREAPEVAPLPQKRPADIEAAPVAKVEAPDEAEPGVDLPRARPEEAVAAPEAEPAPKEEKEPEAPRIFQTACPAVLSGQVQAEALPPISEGQCQAQSPLSITGVLANGRMIPFSAPATLDCGMASVLPGWVADVDSYLQAHDNIGIASVTVGTSYMCRNVNNAEAGNLSFHGFADALDVVGFTLEDGRTITVEQAWTGSVAEGSATVKFAHDAACGHFTTVLGPEANALHHDHLHLDLGCHGKSCTARLCE